MTTGQKVFRVFNYCFVSLICLSCFLPLLNTLAISFSSPGYVASGQVYFWPKGFTTMSYTFAMTNGRFATAFLVTLKRCALGVSLNLFMMVTTAYPLSKSRRQFGARNFYMTFYVITMLFGGGLIPTYILYARLRLINNFWVYVLPRLGDVIHIMMLRTAFESIPDSLEESARLDGCGYFTSFVRIALPLSKAVIAVVTLFTAVSHWNDWFAGAFYMTSTKLWPVATVLQQMLERALAASRAEEVTDLTALLVQSRGAVTSDSLKMATVIISTAPILCVYPFAQKYFTKGVMIGAVKG